MWISRLAYDEQHTALIRATAVVTEVKSHNVALQTTLDWMRVRLTQLEYERAALIHNYMGVKLVIPEIEPAPNSVKASDILNQTLSFEDVGDEEATKQGITWDSQGELVYSRK
jgi:hypothetical protein